jgi:hypothetical protein
MPIQSNKLSLQTLVIATTMLLASLQARRVVMAFNSASPIHFYTQPICTHLNGIRLYMSSTKDFYDYNSLKVSELRDLLQKNGLPVIGIKAELVDRLTKANIKGGGDAKTVNGRGAKLPPNLAFLKQNGDTEEWDNEEIDDEEDDEDDEFDPNHTVLEPRKAGKSVDKRETGGRQKKSQDDFQSTRVFVQGIPKDATWQEVS